MNRSKIVPCAPVGECTITGAKGSSWSEVELDPSKVELAITARAAELKPDLQPDEVGGGHSVRVELEEERIVGREPIDQERLHVGPVLGRPAAGRVHRPKRKWRPEIERDRSMRAYQQNPRALSLAERLAFAQPKEQS